MRYQHILFGADIPGIPVITVNRPEKLNALSAEVLSELKDAFERIAATARFAPRSLPEPVKRPSSPAPNQ